MEEKQYHLHCFKCSKCGVVLEGNYYVAPDGKFVCPSDYLVRSDGDGERDNPVMFAGDSPQVWTLPSPYQGEDPEGAGHSVPPLLLQVFAV